MEDMINSFREVETQLPDMGMLSLPVDIEERGDTITVTADLPGVKKENIDVSVSEKSLEIEAGHEEEVEEEQKNYYRRERSSRRYRRTVSLPAPVDPDSAGAEYENGVLTVTLDRVEEEGRKTVEVS